jgi:hypothetical protein
MLKPPSQSRKAPTSMKQDFIIRKEDLNQKQQRFLTTSYLWKSLYYILKTIPQNENIPPQKKNLK